MGLGFAERRACCLLRLPGSGREGAGRDAPPELKGKTPGIYSGRGASGSLLVPERAGRDTGDFGRRQGNGDEGCGRLEGKWGRGWGA